MNTVCDRDWPEDFEHENGEYMNTCCECRNTFAVHKRRVVCKACATIIQGGEAVAVVTTWHPDSRSYEEQIVKHDTKGSRKSLGAMNAKLRAKVGRLERELSTVKQSLTVEPVAYAAFADNGNIRMWCRSAIGMCELIDEHGNKAVPLYTHPADQVADDLTMVKVSRELLEQIAVELEHDNDRYFLGRELRALLNGGQE